MLGAILPRVPPAVRVGFLFVGGALMFFGVMWDGPAA